MNDLTVNAKLNTEAHKVEPQEAKLGQWSVVIRKVPDDAGAQSLTQSITNAESKKNTQVINWHESPPTKTTQFVTWHTDDLRISIPDSTESYIASPTVVTSPSSYSPFSPSSSSKIEEKPVIERPKSAPVISETEKKPELIRPKSDVVSDLKKAFLENTAIRDEQAKNAPPKARKFFGIHDPTNSKKARELVGSPTHADMLDEVESKTRTDLAAIGKYDLYTAKNCWLKNYKEASERRT